MNDEILLFLQESNHKETEHKTIYQRIEFSENYFNKCGIIKPSEKDFQDLENYLIKDLKKSETTAKRYVKATTDFFDWKRKKAKKQIMTKKTISFIIDCEKYKIIKMLSANEGVTISDLLKGLVDSYLAEHSKQVERLRNLNE